MNKTLCSSLVNLLYSSLNNFFLVGNPFMANMDMDAFFAENTGLEKKFWSNLCAALERTDLTDLIEDSSQYDYIKEQLTIAFKKRTMREWEEYLVGKDTCVTPVLNFDEACAAPQTIANDMVITVQDEELGEYKLLGNALKLSKTPASVRKRAPRLGEDNDEILHDL